MLGVDKERAQAARRVLFDAIAALQTLGTKNFVLVGAQAVYLRAVRPLPNLAPFTYDADLLVDVRFVSRVALYDRLIESGFELRGTMPGFYKLRSAPKSAGYDLDVLVPARGAPMSETEYTKHGLDAVFAQPGLELCVTDNSPMTLPAQAPDEPELRINVANITSLVIAKSFKIGERFDQGPDAFEQVGKDVGDIFRLLSAGTSEEYAGAIRALGREAYLHETARTGVSHLERLCSKDGPGVRLLGRTLGNDPETPGILQAFPLLVNEFSSAVKANT